MDINNFLKGGVLDLTAFLCQPDILTQIHAMEAGIRASIAKGETQPAGICFNDEGLHILFPTVESAEEGYKDFLKTVDMHNVYKDTLHIVGASFNNVSNGAVSDAIFNQLMGSIFVQAVYNVLGIRSSTIDELRTKAYAIFNTKVIS